MADEFDPTAHKADEVKTALEQADPQERDRIAAAELAAKKPRKSVLEAAGVSPDERRDASGRVLHPWEVSPQDQAGSVATQDEDSDEE